MRTLHFEIELLSDTVLPAQAATSGALECLGYLPGSALLGVAAARLYEKLGDRAFDAFHSGQVRFLPGYPLGPDGSPSLPAPRSYHSEKYARLWQRDAGRLPDQPSEDLVNLASGQRMERPTALESGFMTAAGHLVEPPRRVLLKTAIDPKTGRAQQGQLFSYEALRAGTRLLAGVQLDDEVDRGLDAQLTEALTRGTFGLGRSRTAEFGRARAKKVDAPADWKLAGEAKQGVLFYLASDLALVDPDTGQPTLEPRARHFGLPEQARVDWSRTFLRTRRYSPINGKRERPDLERQVLEAGGVIAFETGDAIDLDELCRATQAGVGLYRAEGLGQVLVQPQFLAEKMPSFKGGAGSGKTSSKPVEPPRGPLLAWLEDRQNASDRRERAWTLALEWTGALERHARQKGAPGKSAWGFVRERAALAKEASALRIELFAKKDSQGEVGLLRRGVRQEPWKVRAGGKSLADRLESLLSEVPKEKHNLVLDAVQILAGRMVRMLAQSKDKAGGKAGRKEARR